MTKPHFRDVRAALETQIMPHVARQGRLPDARKPEKLCHGAPLAPTGKLQAPGLQARPLLPPPDFNLPQLVTYDPKVSASLNPSKQVSPNCSLIQQWRAIDRLVGTEALALVLADCAMP